MGKTGEVKTGESRTGDTATRDPDWLLDSTRLETLTAERRTARDLQHTYRVDQSTLDGTLAPLRQTAAKVDTVTAADGSFRTLDRADTDGVYDLRPPADRDPPRRHLDVLVAGYDQRPVDQSIDRYEVSVTYRVDANREPDGQATDETAGAGEWALGLRSATIATKRVTPRIQEGTPENVDRVELTLVLDATQTKIVEESLTRTAASSVDEVPDGSNRVTDNSADPADANVVTVISPDTALGKTGESKTGAVQTGGFGQTGSSPIENGEYVALEWATEWRNADAYRVTLNLAKK